MKQSLVKYFGMASVIAMTSGCSTMKLVERDTTHFLNDDCNIITTFVEREDGEVQKDKSKQYIDASQPFSTKCNGDRVEAINADGKIQIIKAVVAGDMAVKAIAAKRGIMSDVSNSASMDAAHDILGSMKLSKIANYAAMGQGLTKGGLQTYLLRSGAGLSCENKTTAAGVNYRLCAPAPATPAHD